MVEAGQVSPRRHGNARAINVSLLDAGLLDAVVRLVRLLDTPAEATFLLPRIKREIVYRLLKGEQSERLRHIALQGDHTHRIAKAIQWPRNEFDQPLRIDDIAQEEVPPAKAPLTELYAPVAPLPDGSPRRSSSPRGQSRRYSLSDRHATISSSSRSSVSTKPILP